MLYRLSNVVYRGKIKPDNVVSSESIHTVGIDTEAYTNGKCFMICTSLGDIWTPGDLPGVLFSRANRDTTYVAYNLKYDESAILQGLPHDCLQELRATGKTEYNKYTYRFIAYKFLSIRHSNHTCTFYDIYGFYGGSLNDNAKKYLGDTKIDYPTKRFTKELVQTDFKNIAAYCIQDAILVNRLAGKLISVFESYNVYPRKLYSTAYISYQYFASHTHYVTVKKLYDRCPQVLDYAMQAYNGGKFEVTQKGRGYYYEYDIISAYPYEIANLVSLQGARVMYSPLYHEEAIYGFIRCKITIPPNISSPVALRIGELCVFPFGNYTKIITKSEYDYLLSQGCDLTILSAYWVFVDTLVYPYREAIEYLVSQKQKYKDDKESLYYHTVKILMNSLYGKFVQLIKKGEHYEASTCWNPIYGSIITANTRIKVTTLQQKYSSICAVHTDSVISTERLRDLEGDKLGDFCYEREGDGIILGCGVYQIGGKSKIRGFHTAKPLIEYCDIDSEVLNIKQQHVISWKEAALHNVGERNINEFVEIEKGLHVRMDRKRIWLNDFKTFREALQRTAQSLPLDAALLRVVR